MVSLAVVDLAKKRQYQETDQNQGTENCSATLGAEWMEIWVSGSQGMPHESPVHDQIDKSSRKWKCQWQLQLVDWQVGASGPFYPAPIVGQHIADPDRLQGEPGEGSVDAETGEDHEFVGKINT